MNTPPPHTPPPPPTITLSKPLTDPVVVRASDISLAISNPLLYHFTCVRGLSDPFHFSSALKKGQWFHTLCELSRFRMPPPSLDDPFLTLLTDTLQDVRTVCNRLGMIGDVAQERLDAEHKAAVEAYALFEGARHCPIQLSTPDPWYRRHIRGNSFYSLVNHPGSTIIGIEPTICLPSLISGGHPLSLVCQPDVLVLLDDKLWIIDWKTTSFPAKDRLARVLYDPATFHYSHIVHSALTSGLIPNLPPDTTFGGMIHVAIQKPSIGFGSADRPYHYRSEGKRTGRTGTVQYDPSCNLYTIRIWTTDTDTTIYGARNVSLSASLSELHEQTGKKPEKVFDETPSRSNHVRRVHEWFTSTGQYEHLADQRAGDPLVAVSRTEFTGYDHPLWSRYFRQINHIRRLADTPLGDLLFNPNDCFTASGSPSPWLWVADAAHNPADLEARANDLLQSGELILSSRHTPLPSGYHARTLPEPDLYQHPPAPVAPGP